MRGQQLPDMSFLDDAAARYSEGRLLGVTQTAGRAERYLVLADALVERMTEEVQAGDASVIYDLGEALHSVMASRDFL